MDPQGPNYRKEFLRSAHHAGFGLLTLGLGFLSANPLVLIAGATAYALGWLYLPDLQWFRKSVDRRFSEAQRAASAAQVEEFMQKREALLDGLSPHRRQRYLALAEVCRHIEIASADNPVASADPATDPRLRKLDELMWTYLRLLSIEESLERFLETERQENLPEVVKEAELECDRLSAEVESMKSKGGTTYESRKRLLGSRIDRLEVLRKRLQRIQQANENVALVISEQERLDQQIKLLRADAVATKNAETLTARIDATVEHLDQTNRWIAELDEFKDLVGDVPATEFRVGFEPRPTPAVVTAGPPRLPPRARQKTQ
jgi:hypothetical protein